jgi:hypothetical protein
MLKFSQDFSPKEKLALEIMLFVASDDELKLKENALFVDKEISKKLYLEQEKPRYLRQRDFVPHLVTESGEIKRGG